MVDKFQVGQPVQLLEEARRYLATPGIRYTVIRLLPESDGERSYRIKSARENFERVVIESQLVKA